MPRSNTAGSVALILTTAASFVAWSGTADATEGVERDEPSPSDAAGAEVEVAEADDAHPLPAKLRLTYASLTAVRLNPTGLSTHLDLGLKYRLFDSPHVVLRDAYVGLRISPDISPSVTTFTSAIEVKPLSVLMLSVGHRWKGWYGAFGALQAYDRPTEDHSDAARERGADADESFATTGRELDLGVQVLAKVGPVALRDDFHAVHAKTSLEGRGQLFYHLTLDTLVADDGWFVTNDADLVVITDVGVVAGARAHVTHAFYDESLFLPGESHDAANTPIVRVGPLFAYVFYDEPDAFFNRPTLIGIANWYLAHEFRTGREVSQAIPWFVAAFRVEGDLYRAR